MTDLEALVAVQAREIVWLRQRGDWWQDFSAARIRELVRHRGTTEAVEWARTLPGGFWTPEGTKP